MLFLTFVTRFSKVKGMAFVNLDPLYVSIVSTDLKDFRYGLILVIVRFH